MLGGIPARAVVPLHSHADPEISFLPVTRYLKYRPVDTLAGDDQTGKAENSEMGQQSRGEDTIFAGAVRRIQGGPTG